MGRGTRGQFSFRYWSVSGTDKTGVCFKETCWGNNMVRWVWLRFPDGSEKAYAPSHVRLAEAP